MNIKSAILNFFQWLMGIELKIFSLVLMFVTIESEEKDNKE